MAVEALLTTSRVELIDKREFAKAVMDENSETFVVHISVLDIAESSILPSRAAQMAILQWDRILPKSRRNILTMLMFFLQI